MPIKKAKEEPQIKHIMEKIGNAAQPMKEKDVNLDQIPLVQENSDGKMILKEPLNESNLINRKSDKIGYNILSQIPLGINTEGSIILGEIDINNMKFNASFYELIPMIFDFDKEYSKHEEDYNSIAKSKTLAEILKLYKTSQKEEIIEGLTINSIIEKRSEYYPSIFIVYNKYSKQKQIEKILIFIEKNKTNRFPILKKFLDKEEIINEFKEFYDLFQKNNQLTEGQYSTLSKFLKSYRFSTDKYLEEYIQKEYDKYFQIDDKKIQKVFSDNLYTLKAPEYKGGKFSKRKLVPNTKSPKVQAKESKTKRKGKKSDEESAYSHDRREELKEQLYNAHRMKDTKKEEEIGNQIVQFENQFKSDGRKPNAEVNRTDRLAALDKLLKRLDFLLKDELEASAEYTSYIPIDPFFKKMAEQEKKHHDFLETYKSVFESYL